MTDTADSVEQKLFKCELCGLSSKFDYRGTKPPFLKSILLMEAAYVVRDPFSASAGMITLGSDCSKCNRTVCLSVGCSLFYWKRFCMDCVQSHIGEFPVEIKKHLDQL